MAVVSFQGGVALLGPILHQLRGHIVVCLLNLQHSPLEQLPLLLMMLEMHHVTLAAFFHRHRLNQLLVQLCHPLQLMLPSSLLLLLLHLLLLPSLLHLALLHGLVLLYPVLISLATIRLGILFPSSSSIL